MIDESAKLLKPVLDLFLTEPLPQNIFEEYLTESDEGYEILADFIGMHLKAEVEWSTALGIVEAVEHIYREAVANGNLKVKDRGSNWLLN